MPLTEKQVLEATSVKVRDTKTAYQLAFSSPAGELVFEDLLTYSRYADGPASPDNNQTWRLIGRQDVIRHIQQYSNMSEDQLFSLLYGSAAFNLKQG